MSDVTERSRDARERSRSVESAEADAQIHSWGHTDHWHTGGELLTAVSGATSVRIGTAEFRVTPEVALWMPPGTVHAVRVSDDAVLLPVITSPEQEEHLPTAITVVPVTPALRRAAYRQIRAQMFDSPEDHGEEILAALLAALMHGRQPPLPHSRAARTVASRLLANPGAHVSLAQWAEDTFVSTATLRRAFAKETGLTFSAWLTHARLAASIPLLDQGLPVSTVASRVGYGSTSGFIAAYRDRFGCTPGGRRQQQFPTIHRRTR